MTGNEVQVEPARGHEGAAGVQQFAVARAQKARRARSSIRGSPNSLRLSAQLSGEAASAARTASAVRQGRGVGRLDVHAHAALADGMTAGSKREKAARAEH